LFVCLFVASICSIDRITEFYLQEYNKMHRKCQKNDE
jgi:hypothetical protein